MATNAYTKTLFFIVVFFYESNSREEANERASERANEPKNEPTNTEHTNI